MALNINILRLSCELHKKDFFKNLKSVIDMGDQDLYLSYEELVNNLDFLNLKEFEKTLLHAKTFPTRPRLSSSFLWKILGFQKCDRLDIIKIERIENDPF